MPLLSNDWALASSGRPFIYTMCMSKSFEIRLQFITFWFQGIQLSDDTSYQRFVRCRIFFSFMSTLKRKTSYTRRIFFSFSGIHSKLKWRSLCKAYYYNLINLPHLHQLAQNFVTFVMKANLYSLSKMSVCLWHFLIKKPRIANTRHL